MWLGALRRFAIALAIVVAGGALVGLVAGAVIKQGLRRDLAVGFYLSGTGLLALALLLGTRPPVKFKEGTGGSRRAERLVRPRRPLGVAGGAERGAQCPGAVRDAGRVPDRDRRRRATRRVSWFEIAFLCSFAVLPANFAVQNGVLNHKWQAADRIRSADERRT